MMDSTAFFNAKAILPELSLFLDIDPKKETIKDFYFDGVKASNYNLEMQELKQIVMGKNIADIGKISRDEMTHETRLSNGKRPLFPIGLWLLKKAITTYADEGRYFKEQHDMICLCFSVTKSDIVKKVLAHKDYELKTLIQDTMASSACGSCRVFVEKVIIDTRNTHGLIKGLDHSKTRFDPDGHWIKIAGMYPGPLIIKLTELKNEWMAREEITGQFKIEFTNIEGLHLTIKIDSANEKVSDGLILALTDFLKSKLGFLFFIKSAN